MVRRQRLAGLNLASELFHQLAPSQSVGTDMGGRRIVQ